MKMSAIPFSTTDWSAVEPATYPGETGQVIWRAQQCGDIRVRMVECSPNYLADHWCEKGHILLVLEGEVVTEIDDGRVFTLTAGQSFQVADGIDAHRLRSDRGAKLFVVD